MFHLQIIEYTLKKRTFYSNVCILRPKLIPCRKQAKQQSYIYTYIHDSKSFVYFYPSNNQRKNIKNNILFTGTPSAIIFWYVYSYLTESCQWHVNIKNVTQETNYNKCTIRQIFNGALTCNNWFCVSSRRKKNAQLNIMIL